MFTDDSLIQRLHEQNKEYFSRLIPAMQAIRVPDREVYLDLGDSIAFFAGEGSPLTQASGRLSRAELDEISAFFGNLEQGWELIVTPFTSPEALEWLIERRAEPMGWESSLIRPLAEPLPVVDFPHELVISEVSAEDVQTWSDIATRGFFGAAPPPEAWELARLLELDQTTRRYVAYWDGRAAGAASLTPAGPGGIAFLGGMSTLPDFRGRGIQTAMLHRRIKDARAGGELAAMGAKPGTASHRNAERAGFTTLYSELSFRVMSRD